MSLHHEYTKFLSQNEMFWYQKSTYNLVTKNLHIIWLIMLNMAAGTHASSIMKKLFEEETKLLALW